IPASLVPCEWLFQGGAETATNKRSHLGAEHFEQLQMLKFSWRKSLINLAQANSGVVEEVLLNKYKDLLLVDEDMADWENEAGEVHSTT
ncbi:hypothetical protein DFJ58DRAFT_658873, partial [Suillus subalutaceus]|uniref:uncharacterized protein n=1 Tax=Suillus subalutaceus TaxID=48586 RepID=UPI001B86A97F